MKTSELNGLALDYAVTLIENPDALKYGVDDWRQRRKYETKNGEFLFRWTSSWTQSGPIIEQSCIALTPNGTSREPWIAEGPEHSYEAGTVTATNRVTGGTPLIAAMRCYVASKLGDEIDIPTKLMEGK